MRLGASSLVRAATLIGLVLATGCTNQVGPTVTLPFRVPLDRDTPLFLLTQRDRERIVASLESVGLRPSSDVADANGFVLDVRVGSARSGGECGPTSNVTYLVLQARRRVFVVKGRGRTGTCEGNIYDALSAELARNMR